MMLYWTGSPLYSLQNCCMNTLDNKRIGESSKQIIELTLPNFTERGSDAAS